MKLPTRLTLEEMAFEVGRLVGIADRCDVHARDEKDAEIRRDFRELATDCRSLAEGIRDTMIKLMH